MQYGHCQGSGKLAGHHLLFQTLLQHGIFVLQGVGGYNQTGQTGVMHPMGGGAGTGTGMGMGGSNTGMGNTGMGNTGMGGNPDTCEQCGGTGSLAQRMEQGMGLGGGRHQQQGTPQQGESQGAGFAPSCKCRPTGLRCHVGHSLHFTFNNS